MTLAATAAGAAAVALAAALTQLQAVARAAPAGSPRPSTRAVQLAHPARRWAPTVLAAANGRHAAAWLAGLAAGLLVAGLPVAMLAAAAAAGASVLRSRRAAAEARRRHEAAVPALARSLADALRGGSSVRAALGAAAADLAVPAVLRHAVRSEAAALAAGAGLPASLGRLACAGGPSMRLLCGTVALHLHAGGALASQLDRLATGAEAARRVDDDRHAATAQARATVRVVAALPLLAMAAAHVASPEFFGQILGNPVALALLLAGVVLEAVAILAARAIVGSGG